MHFLTEDNEENEGGAAEVGAFPVRRFRPEYASVGPLFPPENGPAAVSAHFLQFSYCHGLEVGYLRAVATFLGATAGSLFNW